MIKVDKLSYEVPVKELFRKISFQLKEGEHCVLIGSNGVGKSTLADLLVHPEKYLYDGKIVRDDCTIGYVNQFSISEKNRDITVFDFLAEVFVNLQKRMEELCDKMAQNELTDDVFEKYQSVLEYMEAVDANNYESRIKKQLKTVFMLHQEDCFLSKLSGGEYKLLQIVKEMLLNPDLLIMDEPDVFLDFEHLNGLRRLINSYPKTLLVITHNRYLLNHCFNKVLHLEDCDLQEFEGDFSEYNLARLIQKIDLKEQSKAEQEEIERTEKMVERMQREASRADIASLGRALHAKQTHLKRLRERAIKAPFLEVKRPEICFPVPETWEEEGKDILFELKDYNLSFEESLLENISFEQREGEKIAIVGANGTGKTTLLHQIYFEEMKEVIKSEECRFGLLSQLQQDVLIETNTVEEELERFGFFGVQEKKEALKKYCFEEEVLSQKVVQLSGGEQNLLQLMKLSRADMNFLLLDEPTSHLDVYAQIELERAVKEYRGAVLLVAHDFYTIVNCADSVLFIEDKKMRKMRIRTFRKLIYEKYFSKEYLELEDKKKELEIRVSSHLKKNDIQTARTLCEELEKIMGQMKACKER